MKTPTGEVVAVAASEEVREPAGRNLRGDPHATPWDEPPCDWGRRGYGQVREITKAHQRDLFFGTW